MTQQLSDEEFQVGFAMAGAISAGAYSAGVFDFFIQALDAWEKARQDPTLADSIPNHRVGIKVITGASAGAITGALGAIALAQGTARKTFTTAYKQKINCVLPSLYDAWVVKPSMVSDTGGSDLLQTTDIDRQGVVSLLDSDLLDEISNGALKVGSPAPQLSPYISSTLHLYMTITNLRGVPFQVTMEGGNYGMMTHGDRVHYCIKDLGSWIAPSKFSDPDNPRNISVQTLFGANGPSKDWQTYTNEAIASGAFPAGLAPRSLSAPLPEYENRSWPMNDWHLDENFAPAWPSPWGDNKSRNFQFLSVDGGVVNNEPFEYTRFSLMEDPPNQNPRDGEDADRAVVMIDPFPEPPDFLPDGKPDDLIISVVKTLIPVMKNQARFKPSELVLAASEAIFSRYMIAPSLTTPQGVDAPYTIACGLLGGFGGFLSRQFREHDFILGQRNCQKFLASSFALPAYNKIIQKWPSAARSNPQFVAPSAGGGPNYYCIIPLIGDAAAEIPVPQWPQMAQADFDNLQARIKQRLDAVSTNLMATNGPGGVAGSLLSWIYSLTKTKVLDFIRYSILSDLVRRNQIEGWDLPKVWKRPPPNAFSDDEVRKVLAEFLNPSFDLRNEAGLASATHLDVAKVRAIISACQAETGAPYEVWQSPSKDKSGSPLYALASRKPSWYLRIPGIQQASEWISPPSVDPPGL